MADYGLAFEDAFVLTGHRPLARFFEETAKASGNARLSANWIKNELMRELDARRIDVAESRVTAAMLAELIVALDEGRISGGQAKELLPRMIDTGAGAASLIEEMGGGQINDPEEIRRVIAEIVAANPKQLEQYRAGKEALFGFFVGQVMKVTNKKANAKIANDLLKEMLK